MTTPEQQVQQGGVLTAVAPQPLPPTRAMLWPKCPNRVQNNCRIFSVLLLIFLLDSFTNQPFEFKFGFAVLVFLFTLVDIAFNVILLKGMRQAKRSYCRLWIGYTMVLTGLSICFLVIPLTTMDFRGAVGQAIAVSKYFYFIDVVNRFVADVDACPA